MLKRKEKILNVSHYVVYFFSLQEYFIIHNRIRLYASLIRFVYQESFFQWCFGVEEPGCYGAINLATGDAILFVPNLPPSYAIWQGTPPTLKDIETRYAVKEAKYITDIHKVLKEKGAKLLLTLVSCAREQMDSPALVAFLFAFSLNRRKCSTCDGLNLGKKNVDKSFSCCMIKSSCFLSLVLFIET